jgi:hypothetical protein
MKSLMQNSDRRNTAAIRMMPVEYLEVVVVTKRG